MTNTAVIEKIRYLLARSDVEAALWLIDAEKDERGEYDCPDLDEMTAYIQKFWPQYFDPNVNDEVYAESGRIEAANLTVWSDVARHPRFLAIRSVINQMFPKKPPRLGLDWGCSKGAWSMNLALAYPQSKWVGVDIDEVSVNLANQKCRELLLSDRCRYMTEEAWDSEGYDKSTYDIAMLMEVLEHVPDPEETLAIVEHKVQEGGLVLVTVPYGAVEYQMWVTDSTRNREHIREYRDPQDLTELFGTKIGVSISNLQYGADAFLKQPIGTWIATFRAGPGELGRTDTARRIRETIPRPVALPW